TIVRSNLNLIHIQNILEYIDFNRLKRCALGGVALAGLTMLSPTGGARMVREEPWRKEKTMQTLWLLGGLGLGAGLMYLLDAEKGDGRRERVRGSAVDAGRQTGAFLDDTKRTL